MRATRAITRHARCQVSHAASLSCAAVSANSASSSSVTATATTALSRACNRSTSTGNATPSGSRNIVCGSGRSRFFNQDKASNPAASPTAPMSRVAMTSSPAPLAQLVATAMAAISHVRGEGHAWPARSGESGMIETSWGRTRRNVPICVFAAAICAAFGEVALRLVNRGNPLINPVAISAAVGCHCR